MTAWFLFAILAFLVFGVPLIDDLYKMNVRRKTKASGKMQHSPPLVPGMNQEHLPASEMPATKAREHA